MIKDFYKINIIKLAKHHKKYCDGENCDISLILLMEMTKELGVKFTDKERELFI